MRKRVRPGAAAILLAGFFGALTLTLAPASGEAGSPDSQSDRAVQAKVNARLQAIRSWAAEPALVAAVRAVNTDPPAEYASMTQEKWADLSVLSPFVRAFSSNEAATLLKGKKTDDVSEFFVSAANGWKVAFLAKPTYWSHKGQAKHEVPMTGKSWQGPLETDRSTGIQQIQVAVPILDAGKPIGSLVVGLALSRLK